MKKLLLLVILGTTAAVAVWGWTRPEAADRANRVIADRIWIDRLPRSDKDMINAFVMFSKHAVGIFETSSRWRGNFEAFRYEANGPELRLLYPQTGDRDKVRVKAKRCSEHGMDFCLELDGASRGVARYYSREGWEIGEARDLDAIKHQIEAVRAQLESGH